MPFDHGSLNREAPSPPREPDPYGIEVKLRPSRTWRGLTKPQVPIPTERG
jgi:hypothetical protein